MKRIILLAFSLLLFFNTSANARTIYVDDDGPADFNNIQAAIDDANNGDTVLVKDGTYTGDGNHDIDFKGKAITVCSENGPENCVIDCDYFRVFHFQNNEDPNSILNGFTITNNESTNIHCEQASPTITNCKITNGLVGIYVEYGSPIITNCTISENTYGGIRCRNGDFTIDNCNIYGNSAQGYGGGIYCSNGNLTIDNCYIYENKNRGGISCVEGSVLTITNSTISRNTNGGIYCGDCDLTIDNCKIYGNSAQEYGGGIYCEIEESNLTINNSTICCNKAGKRGGGIYFVIEEGMPKINNCIISCNTADELGGGIYLEYYNSILTIKNSTFAANYAQNGRALALDDYYFYDFAIADNCIFWDGGSEIQPEHASMYIAYSDVCGGWIGPNIDADPLFVRAPNDGGDGWGDNPDTPDVNEASNDDFGDLHLQSNSPCIEMGNPYLSPDTNSFDIDGQPRVMGQRVDMGVDEFPIKKIIVTEPEGGEIWATASTHQVMWESYFYEGAFNGTVDVLFSKGGGSNWRMIKSGIPDTGFYNWQLPDIVDSNRCLIKVVPSTPDPDFICIQSGIFTIKPSNPDPIVASKWKTLAGDFKRTGLSSNYGPGLGCVKWKFETNEAVSTGVTIGHDDRIHIACEDGKLYTIDANGVLLWSYNANSPLISSPTIGPDGAVYVGSRSGTLYAIDIFGNLRWTHNTGGPIYSSPAVSQDGKIYVCSQDGKIYALSQDGSEFWSFQTKAPGMGPTGSIFASPAIGHDGTVYIASLYDPNLYALDPNDGTVKWVCNFEFYNPDGLKESGWPFASPVVAQDGTIYQTLLYDFKLYAIEPNTGTIKWSTDLRPNCERVDECLKYSTMEYCLKQFLEAWYECLKYGTFEDCLENFGWEQRQDFCFFFTPGEWTKYRYSTAWSEPVLGPDGKIYISFDDPYLRIVEPNGYIKWMTQLDSTGGFTLTVGSDGLVYAAGEDGNLYVLDANGVEVARLQSDAWLSHPVIAANDKIIVSIAEDNSLLITDNKKGIWMISRYGCEDLNIDGNVNFIDLAIFAIDWLECTDTDWPCYYTGDQAYLTSDIDRDRYVFFSDLAALANRWLDNVDWLMQAPCQASNPNPPDGALIFHAWDLALSWSACPDVISHDVYFGTTNPPQFRQNQTETAFYIDNLYGSTYYWRIDEVKFTGTTTGKVWKFDNSMDP